MTRQQLQHIKHLKLAVGILTGLLFISLSVIGYMTMSMSATLDNPEQEIERKWLIDASDIPFDLTGRTTQKISQTYISFSPEIRVRNIDDGAAYILTVKNDLTVDGLSRSEKEYYISAEEYKALLTKGEGKQINKTRYNIPYEGRVWEIDIFEGDLRGLAYLEIEFPNFEEARAFKTPDWAKKDVTDDKRYKNGYLARYGIPKDK